MAATARWRQGWQHPSDRNERDRIDDPNRTIRPQVSPSDHHPLHRRNRLDPTYRTGTIGFSGRIRIVRSPFNLEDDFPCHTICDDFVVLDHAFH
jgi:hypothetical protein